MPSIKQYTLFHVFDISIDIRKSSSKITTLLDDRYKTFQLNISLNTIVLEPE